MERSGAQCSSNEYINEQPNIGPNTFFFPQAIKFINLTK